VTRFLRVGGATDFPGMIKFERRVKITQVLCGGKEFWKWRESR